MPAIQDISESIIRDNITRAIADVYKTMLGRQVILSQASEQGFAEGWPPVHVPGEKPLPQVDGTVGFIGDVNGLIYLYLDTELAQMCTCHMLGLTEAEVIALGDEVVNDAIGEITNMTTGGFKNRLCDAGFPCTLTIPSILRGNNFSIEPISSAQRYIYCFDCCGHRIVADILMKSGD